MTFNDFVLEIGKLIITNKALLDKVLLLRVDDI